MAKMLLEEEDAYRLMRSAGVPVPASALTASREEAAEAAARIGFPVVLKIVSPDVIHKSDAGGVVLNVATPDAAASAYDAIVETVPVRVPGARIEGVLVAAQARPGFELIVGGRTDPSFGKVLTFGLGGTLVEFLHDVVVRVLPMSRDEVRAMVRQIGGYRLIRGYRNYPSLDEEALVDLIARVADLFDNDRTLAEFDLNPVVLYEKGAMVVDARLYIDETPVEVPCIEPEPVPADLFLPRAIAVVGASADPRKVGYAALRNLLSFKGALYPINPNRTEVLGRQAYPSLAAVPGPAEMAVIAVPAELVPGVIAEAGTAGVRLAVILSAGFRESGEEGRLLEEQVMVNARAAGIRVVGPNCLGIMLPPYGINTTFDPVSPKSGTIAFISQSGAVITMVVDWSLPEEIGFSFVISVGNQADLTFQDYLKFAEQDSNTKSIIMYVEEIRDGCGFLKVVRRVTERKPVIVLKSGSSTKGRATASSHTGSLAGDYAVYRGAFEQAGVIAVESFSDAFQIAELLGSEGYPQGRRAVVVTSAGGLAVLSSDYAEEWGVDLITLPSELLEELDAYLPHEWNHQNPLDLIGDAGADRFARVFDTLLRRDDLWDIAIVIAVPSATMDPAHLASEIVRFSQHTDKMIVGCLAGGDSIRAGLRILRENRIPNFDEIEDAFRALGAVFRVRGTR
ncbi:MAG: acetate--CoA ligase family protein [Methanospirillum sp.]